MHRHKKVKGPIFLRAEDPVLLYYSLSPDISQQYIAAGPFIRKFLVFVDCEEAEKRAIWCGLDTRSCWSEDIIILFLLALTCLQLPKLICGFINCIQKFVWCLSAIWDVMSMFNCSIALKFCRNCPSFVSCKYFTLLRRQKYLLHNLLHTHV